MQTGQKIVGSSMDAESQSKAREQAAEHAWCQLQSIEQGKVARTLYVQEGRGDYCYYFIVIMLSYYSLNFRWINNSHFDQILFKTNFSK